MTDTSNPTRGIDLDFGQYVAMRRQTISAHTVGGVPDYAFSLDQKLLQQLKAMAPLREITKAIVSLQTPLAMQIYEREGVAVGPRQYPDIYAIGEECARRLGIGVPRIFIDSSPYLNAFTIATDDAAPMIVITRGLASTLTHDELRYVIGHECGHIHNLHGLYNTAVIILTNKLAQQLIRRLPGYFMLIYGALQAMSLFLLRWSRCAEITSDRAGLICCGDLAVAQKANVKLLVGGGKLQHDINIDEYIKSITRVQSAPVRLMEAFDTHPMIAKRLEALRLFNACDVPHAWRPDMALPPGPLRTKDEIDEICERFISVLATNYYPDAD